MNVKTIFSIFFAFALASPILSQTKFIFTSDDGIIDTTAYNKMKADKIEKYKSMLQGTNKKATIKDTFKEIYRNGDSIIYSYKWDLKVGDINEKEILFFEPENYMNKLFTLGNLKTLDNKWINLNNLKGKPTLINFWFTYCTPCIEEIPALNKLKEKLKDSVNFIAITFDQNEIVRKFLSKQKFNFIQIPNSGNFINSLNITSFPINIFLDKEGKVVRVENSIPYIEIKKNEWVPGDGKDFEETLRKLF